MPQRYQGRRIPAMLYAYPFDHVVAMTLLMAGIVINLSPGSTPSSIAELPAVLATMFRLMCLLGGVLIAIGLSKGEHRWGFTSEMVGMSIAAGVFGTYAIGILGSMPERPGGLLAFVWAVGTSLGCILRAAAINIESKLRLQLLVEAGEIQRGKRG